MLYVGAGPGSQVRLLSCLFPRTGRKISPLPFTRDAFPHDGPGIPDDALGTALVRGARLDETQPGTGLGLAIVSDLVEAYGGSLTLGRSPLGGLSAAVRLPRRQ